jgi:hypothetical protein
VAPLALALRGAALGRNCIAHAHPSLPPPLLVPARSRPLDLSRAQQPKIDANSTRLALSRRPKGAHVTQHLFDQAASLTRKRLEEQEAAKQKALTSTQPRITAKGRQHYNSKAVGERLFDEAKARRQVRARVSCDRSCRSTVTHL